MFNRLFGQPVPSITVQETWERLSSSPAKDRPVLIDVREDWEYQRGHARGALSIPMSQLGQRVGDIPRNREVFVICQSGSRSSSVVRQLMEAGYTRVSNVQGGTSAWRMHHLPLD